jgi:hypothetical protein
VTIAITIATIGRLMKKAEITRSIPLLRHWSSRRRDERRRVDDQIRFDLLDAFDDDSFTGRQAAFDDPQGADALADRDRPNPYCVGGVDDRNLVATL